MGKDFKHISEMEEIFDKVLQTQSAFEKAIEEYRELQVEIEKLEAYYSSKQRVCFLSCELLMAGKTLTLTSLLPAQSVENMDASMCS